MTSATALAFNLSIDPGVSVRVQPVKLGDEPQPLVAEWICRNPPPYADACCRELLEALEGHENARGFLLAWDEVPHYLAQLKKVPSYLRQPDEPLRWHTTPWRPTLRSFDRGDGIALTLTNDCVACAGVSRVRAAQCPGTECEVELLAWGDERWVRIGSELRPLDADAPRQVLELFPLPHVFSREEIDRWREVLYPAVERWSGAVVEDRYTEGLVRVEPEPVLNIEYVDTGYRVRALFRYAPCRLLAAAGSQTPLIQNGKRYLRDWSMEEHFLKHFDAILPDRRLDGSVLVDESQEREFWLALLPRLREVWELR